MFLFKYNHTCKRFLIRFNTYEIHDTQVCSHCHDDEIFLVMVARVIPVQNAEYQAVFVILVKARSAQDEQKKCLCGRTNLVCAFAAVQTKFSMYVVYVVLCHSLDVCRTLSLFGGVVI